MCTSLMDAWDGNARSVDKRASLVMIARSPIDRLTDVKRKRGWKGLRLYSDPDAAYTRDYVSAEDGDVPAINVFTRRDGAIRHFWSAEMSGEMCDPGQDPRGAPDPAPLWTILDMTPEGRRADWYPSIED